MRVDGKCFAPLIARQNDRSEQHFPISVYAVRHAGQMFSKR
jgi:hypothetical protein